jgi:predicted GNAT family N-acyltransferase
MARALMQIALEWCAANQVDAVILHASAEGRRLYESLGFEPTNEMRLTHRYIAHRRESISDVRFPVYFATSPLAVAMP